MEIINNPSTISLESINNISRIIELLSDYANTLVYVIDGKKLCGIISRGDFKRYKRKKLKC